MKCPMRFGNPCADVDEECVGPECMWWVKWQFRNDETEGCAVAFQATSSLGDWFLNGWKSEVWR